MEFGNRERFAIAVELDSNHGGAWLFGRICYWIGGEMVGDYSLGTSLRDVLIQSSYIRGDTGKRICLPLVKLDKGNLFSLISDALDEKNDEIFQYIENSIFPARFDIRIPVDVFDSWKIFLIEGDDKAKLIYKRVDSSRTAEFVLSPGEFDSVFGKAYAYLEHLYDVEESR